MEAIQEFTPLLEDRDVRIYNDNILGGEKHAQRVFLLDMQCTPSFKLGGRELQGKTRQLLPKDPGVLKVVVELILPVWMCTR
ncbi:MAG: hypothetical protein Phog2KO_49900 [Phototrophicaceae bacterium]